MNEILINPQTISILNRVHGIFNFAVLLLFFYQAYLGLEIRYGCGSTKQLTETIRKHRTNGPRWAILAFFGYLAGLSIVYAYTGMLVVFPFHLWLGTLLILSILATYLASRQIDRSDSWRTVHFTLAIITLIVFLIQVVAGMQILLSLG